MNTSDDSSPADRLLSLIEAPDPTHDNWPDFLDTLEAIHDPVRQIVVAMNDGEEWLIDGIDELARQREAHTQPKLRGLSRSRYI